MRSSALYMSTGLHVGFLILLWTGLPFIAKRKFEIPPPPIVVEFAELAPVTETPKIATTPPKPEKVEEKPPEESKPQDKPKPAPKNDSAQPVTPQKTDAKSDKKDDAVLEKLPDKKAPPDKKADKKEKKEKDTKAATDFASVLKNLAEPKEITQGQGKMNLNEPAKTEGIQAPLGAKLTMSEEDALRQQLERCWNVPIGARDVENMIVVLHLVVSPDRTVLDARVVDQSRYNSDSFFRAAADSAMRAIRNPLCTPLALPPDKYESWKAITVNFNPKDMF